MRSAVIAMYESRARAEVAFDALRSAGIDVHPLTILGAAVSVEDDALRFNATGIPAKRAVIYERDVSSGKFLVLASGSADAVGQACAVLGATSPSRLTAHAV